MPSEAGHRRKFSMHEADHLRYLEMEELGIVQ